MLNKNIINSYVAVFLEDLKENLSISEQVKLGFLEMVSNDIKFQIDHDSKIFESTKNLESYLTGLRDLLNKFTKGMLARLEIDGLTVFEVSIKMLGVFSALRLTSNILADTGAYVDAIIRNDNFQPIGFSWKLDGKEYRLTLH